MSESKAVWYRAEPNSGWIGGKLHAWGSDYKAVNLQTHVQFPVAIIQDEKTGVVLSIPVGRVCFASIPPR